MHLTRNEKVACSSQVTSSRIATCTSQVAFFLILYLITHILKKPGDYLKQLISLFFTFAKVGVMTFGGGYAMLPILQREVVENKGWATEEELMDYFAIGQCTPGVIAVNTATFIGQKNKGILGGIIATLGVVFPSLVIISLLAGVIEAFSHLTWVQNAFGGIRVCVCVLIANAVVKLYKKAVVDVPTFLIFLIVALGSVLLDISPVVFVVIAAVAGIILKVLGGKKA